MTTPAAKRLRDALGGALKRKFLRITSDDLTAAATSQPFEMGSLPAGSIVVGFDKDVTVAFTGLTAPDVSLGDSTGALEFLDASDIASVERASGLVAATESDGNGVAVRATVRDTATNLDQATAGSMDVAVLYLEGAEVGNK